MKKRKVKQQNLLQLVIVAAIIIIANVISSYVFTRIDLTSEKRFTLSAATRSLLSNLKDIVYVKVYLEGDFPAGFKRLRNATQEILDEMRTHAKENLEYEFIDPSENPDQKERNNFYRQLADKGLQPTNLEEKTNEGVSQKIIFPGALFTYAAQEAPLQLLKDQLGGAPEMMLNNSIQSLEFEIANTIRKITNRLPLQIAFIEGHGELSADYRADIEQSLKELYDVKPVTINQQLDALKYFKAAIIAKPASAFDEKDKFIIDQFIMKGGKVLWLIDALDVSMDSVGKYNETIAVTNDLNLEDMLFRYGVRINDNLLLDLRSAPIPVVTGFTGNKPRQSLLPWYYYPLAVPVSNHPVVNNLNDIKFEFVSSMDTVGARGVKKTVLLTTSPYTRILNAPVRVNLGIMQTEPKPEQYNKTDRAITVLLEGTFESLYKNRIPPEIQNSPDIKFKEKSDTTKMIVISDGDVIRNGVARSGGIIPMGYDRYTNTIYGNKSFILNCIDYLCDDSGLITVRSKELKLRMLDKTIVKDNVLNLKIANVSLPLVLLIAFGVIKSRARKRKYAKKNSAI